MGVRKSRYLLLSSAAGHENVHLQEEAEQRAGAGEAAAEEDICCHAISIGLNQRQLP